MKSYATIKRLTDVANPTLALAQGGQWEEALGGYDTLTRHVLKSTQAQHLLFCTLALEALTQGNEQALKSLLKDRPVEACYVLEAPPQERRVSLLSVLPQLKIPEHDREEMARALVEHGLTPLQAQDYGIALGTVLLQKEQLGLLDYLCAKGLNLNHPIEKDLADEVYLPEAMDILLSHGWNHEHATEWMWRVDYSVILPAHLKAILKCFQHYGVDIDAPRGASNNNETRLEHVIDRFPGEYIQLSMVQAFAEAGSRLDRIDLGALQKRVSLDPEPAAVEKLPRWLGEFISEKQRQVLETSTCPAPATTLPRRM